MVLSLLEGEEEAKKKKKATAAIDCKAYEQHAVCYCSEDLSECDKDFTKCAFFLMRACELQSFSCQSVS